MRSSVAARADGARIAVPPFLSKLTSFLLAAVLACGLLPVQALAVEPSLALIPEGDEGAVRTAPSVEEVSETFSHCLSDDPSSADADGAALSSEDVDHREDANLSADGIINQTMPLSTVAQAESTRAYFLAQTLESTKTVPVVSAKLPLDSGTNQQSQTGADGGQIAVGSEDKVTDGDLPAVSTEAGSDDEGEGGEDSDESDLGGTVTSPGVAAESTVVGAFEYLGMTFAVEPGGESVALVAVDYSKLPEEFIQKQVIVIPDMATPDELDYYSVTRIADNAFASLTKETANPDYTGCIELFSDEELLAEAGISQEEVQDLLTTDGAAGAAQDGDDVETTLDNNVVTPSSSVEAPLASSDEEEATGANDEASEVDGSEETLSDGIRAIVSMVGNVATLDDGSTYVFTNPLVGCTGILALGIPASVSSIGGNAFAGTDTLQYLVVSEDNPEYSSYDGALYDADQANLIKALEGRVGAVRIAPSATTIDSEAFSHCPLVDALVADADSAAYQLLSENVGLYACEHDRPIDVLSFTDSIVEMANRPSSDWFSELLSNEFDALWPTIASMSLDADVWGMAQNGRSVFGASYPWGLADNHKALYLTLENRSTKDLGLGWATWVRGASTYPSIVGASVNVTVASGSSQLLYVYNHVNGQDSQQALYLVGGSTGIGGYYVYGGSGWRSSYGAALPGNSGVQPITGLLDSNGNAVPLGSRLTFGATYIISEINGKNILDYEVSWDAGSYGSLIVKSALDPSESIEGDGGILKQIVPRGPLNVANTHENVTSVLSETDIVVPEGFVFRGWATQAGVDDLGNPAFATTYDVFDPETLSFSTYTCPAASDPSGVYLVKENLGSKKLVIEDDLTFYPVFACAITWDVATYGGMFADDSVVNRIEHDVYYGHKVAVPAVKPEDASGWTFAGWTTRQKDANGDLVADANLLDGVKLNPYITTSRTGTVTATRDNYGYSDESENVHYYAVWNMALAWERMEGAVDGMVIDASGVPTSVIYGTTVTAPVVQNPASHHFSHWTAADGAMSSPGANESDPHAITIKTPGPITAYWAPNEGAVLLSGNGASASQDQHTYARFGEAMPLRKANAEGTGLDYTGVGWLSVPVREGYEFAGYWNTRYTEDASKAENGVPLTNGATIDGVMPKQYYGVDDAGNLTSVAVWDITNNDQQLFAHWRYKVVLDLNVFNADGEAVLADAIDDDGSLIAKPLYAYAAELGELTRNGNVAYTEQGPIESDADDAVHALLGEGTRAVVVQDDASEAGKAGYTNLAYERYVFTAIDGAPIQLPSVSGREGYDETHGWKMLVAGGVPEALDLDGNGVTTGTTFFPKLTDTKGGISSVAGSTSGKALVLAADWTDRAKRYKVTLQASYLHDGTGQSLKGSPETQVIEAVYDQPLLLADVPNITATAAAPVYQNQDSLRDNPTNLVFLGFYNEKNGAYTAKDGAVAAGRRYIMAETDAADATQRTAVTAMEAYGAVEEQTRPARFREPSAGTTSEGFCTATLYALWGYPQVVVSFDYQGGTSSDFAGVAAPEVERELTTLDAMPADLAVPVREGYRFNGFWTTRYSETDAATRYYDENMRPTEAHTVLQSTVDLPLYAHWIYYVAFDKNLPDSDKAELDTSFAATDTTMVNVAVPLVVTLPSAGEAPDYVDASGNRFFESIDDKGTTTVVIEAIAGAPVELKAVHDRTLLDGTPTGYDATARFTQLKDRPDTLLSTVPVGGKPMTAEYPARDAYPTPLAYLSGDAAANVSGGAAGEPYTVMLYADWSASRQDFWVQLTYSYDQDVLDPATQRTIKTAVYGACTEDGHENGHIAFADPAPFTVTYDGPVVAEGGRLDASQITAHAFSEVTPASGGEPETHANLDLVGIFAADRNEAGRVISFRSKYVDSTGMSSNATDCDLAFREYYLPAKVNAGDSEALQQAARANAVKLYARWTEPTREVLFNYYDAASTADSTVSNSGDADTLTLQKGDRVAEAADPAALRAIAEQVKSVHNLQDPSRDERYATYEFAGFWTHPYYEGAYDADGDGVSEGFSKQYFAMDGAETSLKAVSPTSEDAAQRAIWEEDRTTTLYAHWKFDIEATANPLRPDAAGTKWYGADDMLYFTSASGSMEDDSRATVSIGTFVYGDTAFIQHDPSLVCRTRDFDLTVSGRDVRRTGYLFDGWYGSCSEQEGLADALCYVDEDEAGFDARFDTRTLTPGTDKKATLYAKWVQEVYDIELIASNAESAYPDFHYNGQVQTIANEGARTRRVSVAYDEPLGGPITAPDMVGYTFLGYCTDPQSSAPEMDGGTYRYAGSWPDATMFYDGASTVGGAVIQAATEEPWVLASETAAARQTAKLYAHYYQRPSSISFELIDGVDAADTLEMPRGSNAFDQAKQRTWFYGKPLTSADIPDPASFARYGYEFAGWYFYPSNIAEPTEASRVFLSDASGDIVLNSDRRWLLDQTRTTLYAAWKPLSYTLEFYYDFPNSQALSRPNATLENVRYEDVLAATETANPLALDAGEVPRVEHDPYRFAGWNTVRGALDNGDNSGYWLLANDPEHDDNLTDDASRLKEAGRFMPQEDSVTTTVDGQRRVVYYAQWYPLDEEFLLLFPGNHGYFSDGWTGGDQVASNVTDRSVVVRQLTNIYGTARDLSATNENLGLHVDAGWQLRGWVKVPAEELPDVAKGERMGRDLAKTSEARAVNAKERTDVVFGPTDWVPNDFDCMNDPTLPFDTYYLVAVYAQAGDYRITLDKNAPEGVNVSIGTWATTGPTYDFKLYRQLADGTYEKHEPIALPAAVREGYTFLGWERYRVDEQGNEVFVDGVPDVVETIPAGGTIDPDAWASDTQSGAVHNKRIYHAKWQANPYTIRLHVNREGDAEFTETVTASYDDPSGFELPYPASKVVGGFFLGFDVSPQGSGSNDSMFFPEDMRGQDDGPYTVNGLLEAVRKYLTATEIQEYQSGLGAQTIELYARWSYTVSATMPVQVLIKIDPDTGDTITAPLQLTGGAMATPTEVSATSAGYAGTEAGSVSPTGGLSAYPLEVVNVRYVRPSASGAFDIGDDVSGGRASLSVYADRSGLDFTRGGNVAPTGEVLASDADGGAVLYRPLKIDLAQDEAIIGKDELVEHGFRPFWGVAGVLPNDLLSLYYGIALEGTYSEGGLTRNLDASYFAKRGQLDAAARDTDKTTPIAYLYYTVKRAS